MDDQTPDLLTIGSMPHAPKVVTALANDAVQILEDILVAFIVVLSGEATHRHHVVHLEQMYTAKSFVDVIVVVLIEDIQSGPQRSR